MGRGAGRRLGTGDPEVGRSPGCPKVPSECPQPSEQSPWACWPLFLLVCVSCFARAAPLLHVFFSLGWGGVVEGLQNSPLWDGGDRRRRTKTEGGWSRPARRPLAQLPGPGPERGSCLPPHIPSPAPRAPWLLSLPGWAPPSQTAARGRGRSISEQRGPCELSNSNLESPFSPPSEKESLCTCTQACMHGTREPGRGLRGRAGHRMGAGQGVWVLAWEVEGDRGHDPAKWEGGWGS